METVTGTTSERNPRRRPIESSTPSSLPSVEPMAPLEPSREQVMARAYELYLARGGAHGHDVEDWVAAERELGAGRSIRSEIL